jgi:hypothetical protein
MLSLWSSFPNNGHITSYLGKEREVATASDTFTGMELGTLLADENVAWIHHLTMTLL